MVTGISDGTFTLQESENENEFFFFRNDGQVLEGIDDEPSAFYQAYIMQKMMNGEINGMVMSNLHWQMSTDGKVIRGTVEDFRTYEEEEETSEESETDENTFEVSPILIRSSTSYKEKKGFWKRLKEKIFGTTQ